MPIDKGLKLHLLRLALFVAGVLSQGPVSSGSTNTGDLVLTDPERALPFNDAKGNRTGSTIKETGQLHESFKDRVAYCPPCCTKLEVSKITFEIASSQATPGVVNGVAHNAANKSSKSNGAEIFIDL